MKDIPIDSWKKRRCFSEFEAELDYIINCDDKGNVDISIRKLSNRWGWNYGKTFRFVKHIIENESESPHVTKVNHLINCLSNSCGIECNKSESLCVTKPKKSKVKEKSTIYKNKFDEIYANKFGAPFYWKPKEMVGIKGIIAQLQFNMKSKDIEISEESTINSFSVFLNSIKDKWILEHFSPSIINSKFNEIVSSIKMSNSKMILKDDSIDKFKKIKTW